MKNPIQCAKNLAALVKKIGKVDPPAFPDADDPVAVLVQSLLLWQSTTTRAIDAYGRIRAQVYDFNELRVGLPYETAELLGTDDPHHDRRARTIRQVLHAVYEHEHDVSLDRLKALGKRDVRKYVEGLDGIPPYVAARLMLVSFGVHAMPVDEPLLDALVAAGAADADSAIDDYAGWLSRQIKSSAGVATHHALQAHVDAIAARPATTRRKKKTAGKKSGTKKTTRKKTSGKKKTSRTSAAKS
ncbi:MAG: hypothetical protein KDA25_06215, partial [Phycisphaerales bacterium]|nr:hypothetical protein [Phycisphaerales bacterium]